MHLHISLKRMLALIMALMLILCTAAMADQAGYVKDKNVRVYENADLSGRRVSIKRYTLVDVLEVTDSTAKIEANGYTVYLPASQLVIFDSDDSEEMVFSQRARIYEYPSVSSRSARVNKGDNVKVLFTINGVAVVEKDGVMAYTYEKTLEKPIEIIEEEYEIAVIADTLKVYKSASTSAKVVATLKKDDRAMLKARTDEWALIELNGVQGCVKLSGIEKYVAPPMTVEQIFASEKLSNEEKIYAYLVYEMKYSSAAACGVLANIKCESTFRPTAWNASGGSYGICQWTGGRYTNLQNWCAENGYDHTTLEAQCRFLKYELENKYKKVNSFMLDVENTPDGAYEAGYYYCYNFEGPANRGSVSIKRGNMAMDDFWPKYNK